MGTFLAYRIDEQYYRNVHYVWCTNKFHSDLQPGTSDPQTIGNTFLHDIKTGEQYSKAIMYNKAGILRGAEAKLKCKIINESEYKEICEIVNCATYSDFFPVLYIINSTKVKKKCEPVKKEKRASDNSIEYLISNLTDGEFEIIDFRELLCGFFRASNRKVVIKYGEN